MIQLGDDKHFQTVRGFLQASYSEDAGDLADRVGDFSPERHHEEPALVRMLFLGRAITLPEWEAATSAEVRRSFDALGLVDSTSNGRIRASCLLYKMRGIFVTSDRFMTDEGLVGRPQQDSVYYALTETAQCYLWSLPMQPMDRVLDLGSGSGVAAMLLAKNCREVYATDIAPRCVLYTEFNKRLNGLQNIEVREGSFYEPVGDLKFDLVTCHPPFDLSLTSGQYVYADGGSDGEAISRGVIGGLAGVLKPGGKYVSAFRATDRVDAPLEMRIRQWLGSQQEEFDIAVVVRSVVKPEEHAISASMLAKQNLDEYQMYMDAFQQMKIVRFVYVHLMIERKAQGTPLTLRRAMGSKCKASDLEALLAWERTRNHTDLVGASLSPSTHMSLLVRHEMKEGELLPVDYRFEVTDPFAEDEPVPEWVAKLVAHCVGGRTTDKVHSMMREQYPIERKDFDAAVKRLISLGVLQLASGSSTINSN